MRVLQVPRLCHLSLLSFHSAKPFDSNTPKSRCATYDVPCLFGRNWMARSIDNYCCRGQRSRFMKKRKGNIAADNLLIFKERNSTSYDIFWPLDPCACLSLPSHPSLRSFGSLIGCFLVTFEPDRYIRFHSELLINFAVMTVAGIFDATTVLIFGCAGRADHNVTLVAVLVEGLITASVGTVACCITRERSD